MAFVPRRRMDWVMNGGIRKLEIGGKPCTGNPRFPISSNILPVSNLPVLRLLFPLHRPLERKEPAVEQEQGYAAQKGPCHVGEPVSGIVEKLWVRRGKVPLRLSNSCRKVWRQRWGFCGRTCPSACKTGGRAVEDTCASVENRPDAVHFSGRNCGKEVIRLWRTGAPTVEECRLAVEDQAPRCGHTADDV